MHQPVVLRSLRMSEGVLTENSVSNGVGKQPKSANSALNCKPAATHSNSGLLLPFWGDPNATNPPRPYSSAQESASSWVSLLLSSRTCRCPRGFVHALQNKSSDSRCCSPHLSQPPAFLLCPPFHTLETQSAALAFWC